MNNNQERQRRPFSIASLLQLNPEAPADDASLLLSLASPSTEYAPSPTDSGYAFSPAESPIEEAPVKEIPPPIMV
jgi:hypothetical protein